MPSEICVIELQRLMCAVEMSMLTEVVVCPPVTYFPGGPDGLLGVINLRGDVLPLFQLETVIGVDPPAGQEESIAVLKDDETIAAFPIRHVRTVLVEKEEMQPHPAATTKPVFLGRFVVDEAEVVLLDVSELMRLLARRMEESKTAICAPASPTVNA